MRIQDYIEKDLVFVIESSLDKSSFLKQLVASVKERLPEIDENVLLTRLKKREEDVSTGIGHGVAIPHATSEGIDKTRCVIAHTPEGVDFEALDKYPVHITFLLISPPGSVGGHLRLLARIARLVSNENFVFRLVKAKDAQEIYTLVAEEDEKHV